MTLECKYRNILYAQSAKYTIRRDPGISTTKNSRRVQMVLKELLIYYIRHLLVVEVVIVLTSGVLHEEVTSVRKAFEETS